MMRYACAGALLLCASAGRAAPGDAWWRANFHAHAANEAVADDGGERASALHHTLRARGFHFSAHTPHSTLARGAGAAEAWRRQRASESAITDGDFTATVGQEVTVAAGPAFQARIFLLGHEAPGNLDHLSLVGSDRFVPSETPLPQACAAAHAGGGVCIVNHPGPGPMMWEDGLWEAPANRGLIDALEVYNGQALAATGIDFEERYRQATAYGGLGLKIAAVTGADTHGPASVARARKRLHGFGQAAKVLEAMAPPDDPDGRPELDAATLVAAPSPSLRDMVAAVKTRRTVAVYRMDGLAIDCPGLGEVRRSPSVKLHLALGRVVREIVLYREGQPVKRWENVASVDFHEEIAQPAAYVFAARDGFGRLLTSAVWYDPRQ